MLAIGDRQVGLGFPLRFPDLFCCITRVIILIRQNTSCNKRI